MPIGRISRLARDKGFGFVTNDSEAGAPDLFIHFGTLARAGIDFPTIGMPLVYEVIQRDKGPAAINVELLGPRKVIETDDD